MLTRTPPMGWNSWNTFGENIDEKLVLESADALVDSGLKDAGYTYLVIDDCWSRKQRDKNGKLEPDYEKFPHGIKSVADYVHAKGLKLGIYSCAGNLTCGAYPGSFEHEFDDADTFASWEIDFLKYDYCYHSPIIPGKYLYSRMGLALENCGRDILFSACSWGEEDTQTWIKETGAGMWRSTPDIFDSWDSIKDILDAQYKQFPYNGLGCFNDMDMLVVGMNGQGHVGKTGCTDMQYRTHFSIWAFMGSPLMIGCDIRNMSAYTKETLTNRMLIEINQDPAYRQPIPLNHFGRHPDETRIFARHLDGGDIAIGMFNLRDKSAKARFNLDQLGLPHSTGMTLLLKEAWTGEEKKVINSTVIQELEPFGCAVYRAKVVRE